jgi:hypothetical protein
MFQFMNLVHTETDKGVEVHGDVCKDGKRVGAFRQAPFTAATLYMHEVDRKRLVAEASSLGMSEPDYCEKLIRDAESVIMRNRNTQG